MEKLKAELLPLPPLSEQDAIIGHINHELSRIIDEVANQHRRELKLMQEYRTRLISDVVTSKLDVRGVDLGELPEFEEVPEDDESIEPPGVGTAESIDVVEIEA